MSFDFNEWRQAFWRNLRDWRARLMPGAVHGAYAAVAASALWPVLIQARSGDAFGAAMALVTLTAALGTNLLSEQIQRWKDEATGEPEMAAWLEAQLASNAALRVEVDQVLEKLEAIGLARAALAEGDRNWFEQTLTRELTRLGNLPRFRASVTGERNLVVQGDHNQVTFTVIEHQEVHHHYPPDPRALEADKAAAARRRYLERFAQWCNVLPLAALGGEEGTADDLTLENVYIGLHTEGRVPLTEAEKNKRRKRVARRDPRDEDTRPLTAREAASQHTRLVLLGDPGSGKSTFARHWLRQLALAGLGIAKPPAGLDPELLPIFLTLRDVAPRLAGLSVEEPLTDADKRQLIQALFDQLEADVREVLRAPDFAQPLRETVERGAVVLVLDGLDEVAHDLRERVRWAVGALIAAHAIQRMLITCRVRSYAGAAVFPGVPSETLAPFTAQHIRDFATHWYRAQPARFDAAQVEARSQDLARAALDADLVSLAGNPMMLTSMAILHQREIGLPRQRVVLFHQLVDVLLRRWQKHKTEQLADFLKDELRLRRTVERLAYEIHARGQPTEHARRRTDDEAAGDLPRGDAWSLLAEEAYLGSAAAAETFLDYIDQRAGLVVGRGGEPGKPARYSFPHRTLQEYLAGCHMASQRQAYRAYFAHAAQNDYWALAAQYGAEDLLYNRRHPNDTLDLAYQLLSEPLTTSQQRRAALWSGNIAALVGPEAVAADQSAPHGGPGYLERIKPALGLLLASDLLPTERAEAGRSLAVLGDRRDEAMTVEGMRFAFVPAGPFRMGSDPGSDPDSYEDERPIHPLYLPDYWIGVHPVTQAQFDVFVAEGGYGEADYWPEAIAGGYWKDGLFKHPWDEEARRRPAPYGEPFDLANHPVVGIAWYEALAFTRWLNRRLRSQLPAELGFGLPSEAEWEKAARGGLRIPKTPLTRGLREGLLLPTTEDEDNPSLERQYPWTGPFDPDRANTAAARIGSTSAVGAFPGGASPYGCLDLAGNVWEWTRSRYGDGQPFPYDPGNDRERLAAAADTARVLRGGSFDYQADYARCANRNRTFPGYRYDYRGFRVVASPFFSRL